MTLVESLPVSAAGMSLRDRPPPIAEWRTAIFEDSAAAQVRLAATYACHRPTLGELIFTGNCSFKCEHCIYAPSFAKFNEGLTAEDWRGILADLVGGLGIGTYVYGGRSLTDEGLTVLAQLRKASPAVRIGLIDNGISMLPVRDRLFEVEADWIDISLDGTEADHDRQRGRPGSFAAGLDGAQWLVRNGAAPKVNILTCLTSINRHSVVPMIRDLHARGFRNFFVTAVTVVDSVRPSQDLRLPAHEFAAFAKELRTASLELDEAWVELGMFAPEYASHLAEEWPELWQAMTPDHDTLTFHELVRLSGTDFFVRYYPNSLTGTRELIVNTNGDVIVPQSMAYGQIDGKDVVGSLRSGSARSLVQRLPQSSSFDFYLKELNRERDLLRRYL